MSVRVTYCQDVNVYMFQNLIFDMINFYQHAIDLFRLDLHHVILFTITPCLNYLISWLQKGCNFSEYVIYESHKLKVKKSFNKVFWAKSFLRSRFNGFRFVYLFHLCSFSMEEVEDGHNWLGVEHRVFCLIVFLDFLLSCLYSVQPSFEIVYFFT